jgi:serine/threonine protein kinase
MRRAVQGTLEYMAPEVLQKQPASAASDVYALAIAINELATGARLLLRLMAGRQRRHGLLQAKGGCRRHTRFNL